MELARIKQLQEWLTALTNEELVWAHGFAQGLLSGNSVQGAAIHNPSEIVKQSPQNQSIALKPKITIAYGTETGNAKKIATDFAAKAKKQGLVPKLIGLDQYKLADLPKEIYFFIVISTQGDGEPPVAAKQFYDYIHQTPLHLPQTHFSVLALGDSSYPLYCQTGEDIDKQFSSFGAQRFTPLVKCDVDYDIEANVWVEQILQKITAPVETSAATPNVVLPIADTVAPSIKKSTGKKNYTGTVVTNINLNGKGSHFATHHLELALEEVEYLPGDSIGIVPENPDSIVDAIIELTGINPEKQLDFKKETGTVRELLLKKINIHYLLESTIKKYAAIVGVTDIPATRVNLIDLLRSYPVSSLEQFEAVIGILNAIPPRLYTIASSPTAHTGEVHITVLKEAFQLGNTEHFGLCSAYLANLNAGTNLPFFVQPNKRFRLPATDKDIIMIGPGTGIAPFRSFIAERDAVGASGRNWLFFGGEQFTTDFLYQTEWQNWHSMGVLTKISLAFNKNNGFKPFVQDKIVEQASELFEWILAGAYIYVCGEKAVMSVAVEKAIVQVIEEQGGMNNEDARKLLHELEHQGRYEKDVY